MDIKNLSIVVGTVARAASMSDKGYSKQMVMQRILIEALPAVLSVDFKLLPAEVKDIDAREMEQLKAIISNEFDLENDMLEILIEDALAFVLDGAKLLGRFKKYQASSVEGEGEEEDSPGDPMKANKPARKKSK